VCCKYQKGFVALSSQIETMTSSQKAFDFINDAISKGLTVYVSTRLKSVVVSPSTYAKWEKAGVSLFKMDKEGNLRMASGKNYNVIATASICMVNISAQ
jgi:hypothetical protein